jgi:hypothetical protein
MRTRKQIREYMKKYRKEHIKILKIKVKIYNQTHKKQRNKYLKFWRIKNKIKLLNYYKTYRKINANKLKQYQRKYRKLHRKELNNKLRIKVHNNINFKIAGRIRKRMCEVLRGNPKLETTMNLVGCSIKKLKQHLESKFKRGMTWFNYGKWHIDHIRPCASFDLSKAKEQRKCFHYKNLQPLWAKENQSKGYYERN